jgi:hypothetical protein
MARHWQQSLASRNCRLAKRRWERTLTPAHLCALREISKGFRLSIATAMPACTAIERCASTNVRFLASQPTLQANRPLRVNR